MILRRINLTTIGRIYFSNQSRCCHNVTISEDLESIIKTANDVPKINPLDPVDESSIEFVNQISPALRKSFNLAAYVNVSETLQKLIQLNVDLSKIDKHTDLATYIVKCDFKKDIEPFVLFLLENKIEIANVGEILNQNPFLLTNSIDDLQVRINYFLFRKFSKNEVATIFTRASLIFSLPTKVIDLRLGSLMKEYQLTAKSLRQVVNKYPKIILLNEIKLKSTTFTLKESMGFSPGEIQSILKQHPIIWHKHFKFTGKEDMIRTFEFVHNEMQIPQERICLFPKILLRRVKLVKPRHLYLKMLNRDQYDPARPLYVPLSAFYELDDGQFCLQYAHTSANDYNEFLKTL